MREVIAVIGNKISLGRRGENMATCVVFDISEWLKTYGEGTVQLIHQRNGDATPYPCVVEQDGSTVRWCITGADVDVAGRGLAELQYYVGDVLVKSETYTTDTERAMGSASDEAPEPQKAWVDNMLRAASDAVESAATAEEAAAAAEASQRAAADSEAAAKKAAEQFEASIAGVTSFNGRSGRVMPQAGDYTADMVGARPSNWMPTAAEVGARPNTWMPTAAEVGAAKQYRWEKTLSAPGWYRLAVMAAINTSAYAAGLRLCFGGKSGSSMKPTPTIVDIALSSVNGGIRKTVDGNYTGYITKVRLVKDSAGNAYVDVYYAATTSALNMITGTAVSDTFYTRDLALVETEPATIVAECDLSEWLDPPMVSGAEYRTTERINGKAVYKRTTSGVIEYRLDGETEWEPYAEAVGARPATWMPTAAQVGAAPAGFGLGTNSVKAPTSDLGSGDANKITGTGFYTALKNTAFDAYGWSNILHIHYNNTNWIQLGWHYARPSLGYQIRRCIDGVIGAWRPFYDAPSISVRGSGAEGQMNVNEYRIGMLYKKDSTDSNTWDFLGVFGNNTLKDVVKFYRKANGVETNYSLLHTGNVVASATDITAGSSASWQQYLVYE